ncbi:hypothetical protein LTR64_003970 [Lithohypha guttulata]|uniref:uncharacterized protein n=1 Tax=Lithohypha guttulata TaxID=1690604 RepID=UPI002DDF1771|nr:hypothetical protein LTR51_007008 [Lithohypha guttulata]
MSSQEPEFRRVRPMPLRRGLRWEPGCWPAFTVGVEENRVDELCRMILSIPQGGKCECAKLDYGTRSQLWSVDTGDARYVLKVLKAVFPVQKLENEVATMQFIADRTSIPVPEVIAYSAYTATIGFEWILMTRIPGKDLGRAGIDMSIEQKSRVVKELASYQRELLQITFPSIGSLMASHYDQDSVSGAPAYSRYDVGPSCSTDYFLLNHLSLNMPRGPFNSVSEWLSTTLDIFIHAQTGIMKRSLSSDNPGINDLMCQKSVADADVDEDDKDSLYWGYSRGSADEAGYRKTLAQEIQSLISTILQEERSENMVLYHHDLNTGNIMVDEAGGITGIIDWELTLTVPLWQACQLPLFLRRRPGDISANGGDEAGPIEQEYWERLTVGERDFLSREYTEAIKASFPEWTTIQKDNVRNRSLVNAVATIGAPDTVPAIARWVKSVKQGQPDSNLGQL